MANFEGKERRMPKIEACLKEYGMATLEDARQACLDKGIDVEKIGIFLYRITLALTMGI